MSRTAPSGRLRELARYLEVANLGLNLPFALAFLLVAARGLPSPLTVLWILLAFVGARNAGHSFNRWADRAFDAANPRTRDRALVTGRFSPAFALGFAAANAALLVVAAYLLNPLAFLLSGVALVLIFGYSFTKRLTPLTTPFLGLVEAITPAAVYIAVDATLPGRVLLAVGAMLAYGTAFEVIHSLGDLDADRAASLRSLPLSLGRRRALALLPGLHGGALALFALYGLSEGLGAAYLLALAAIAALAAWTDIELALDRATSRQAFRRHFLMSAVFLAGVVASLGAGLL